MPAAITSQVVTEATSNQQEEARCLNLTFCQGVNLVINKSLRRGKFACGYLYNGARYGLWSRNAQSSGGIMD